MEQNSAADYTCPYCRWSKSHSWSQIREEEQTIDSKYLGSDISKTYYLDTKKKFKVRICSKCARNLKIRSYLIWTPLTLMLIAGAIALLGIIVNMVFNLPAVKEVSSYILAISLGFAFITFLVWLLWKMLGPSRAHVKYDRADRCNALNPFYSPSELAAMAEMYEKIKPLD